MRIGDLLIMKFYANTFFLVLTSCGPNLVAAVVIDSWRVWTEPTPVVNEHDISEDEIRDMTLGHKYAIVGKIDGLLDKSKMETIERVVAYGDLWKKRS